MAEQDEETAAAGVKELLADAGREVCRNTRAAPDRERRSATQTTPRGNNSRKHRRRVVVKSDPQVVQECGLARVFAR